MSVSNEWPDLSIVFASKCKTLTCRMDQEKCWKIWTNFIQTTLTNFVADIELHDLNTRSNNNTFFKNQSKWKQNFLVCVLLLAWTYHKFSHFGWGKMWWMYDLTVNERKHVTYIYHNIIHLWTCVYIFICRERWLIEPLVIQFCFSMKEHVEILSQTKTKSIDKLVIICDNVARNDTLSLLLR